MPAAVPSQLRRLLDLLRPEARGLALALVCTLLLAGATSLFAYFTGPLLGALLLGRPPEMSPWAASLLAAIYPGPLDRSGLLTALPLGLVTLAALKGLAQFGQATLLQGAGIRVTARLRRALYRKLLLLPPAFFQSRHSGDLFTRFSSDAVQVENALGAVLVAYVKDLFTALALLGMCALLDLRLFAVLLVAAPLAAFPVARFAKALKRIAGRSQGALGQTTERVSEVLTAMRIVQAFRQESAELSRFDAAQDSYLAEMRRSFLLRAAFTPLLETLGAIGLAIGIDFGASAVASGALPAEHLLSFLAAALLLYQPVKSLAASGQLVVAASASADRLFEILDAPEQVDAAEATPLPAFAQAVRFEGVHFGYGDGEVLRGLELEIRRGERVALVGPSGGGKSTVASLLLGFWRASGGRLVIDGRDLTGATLASWRSQIALVTQEPVLFQGSIADNLLTGRPRATVEELRAACVAAGAWDFVQALPAGLDAPVGERGSLLSGGQRQRVALARALLRSAPLLVLDEATSSLDSESEQAVERGLGRLLEGRAALIIAHRLSTVRRADRIAVLDGGRIVEQGTHDELVARGGLYGRLWTHFVGASPVPV